MRKGRISRIAKTTFEKNKVRKTPNFITYNKATATNTL